MVHERLTKNQIRKPPPPIHPTQPNPTSSRKQCAGLGQWAACFSWFFWPLPLIVRVFLAMVFLALQPLLQCSFSTHRCSRSAKRTVLRLSARLHSLDLSFAMLKRPSLPLACTMLICTVTFLGSALMILTYAAPLIALISLAPTIVDQIVTLLPLLGFALLALFSSFTFVRILFHGSHLVARLFLVVNFVLSSIAAYSTWGSHSSDAFWSLGWIALIVALFFFIKPSPR